MAVLSELDLAALRRWLVAARTDLATHAAALDRLNVFPVPDGDTGTNLRVTVQQAVRMLAAADATSLTEAAAVLARAMLVSARGNSGVILSQLVRGLASVVEETGGRPLDGPALTAALRAASDLAWSGVARPVEGTILSVARAAAEGAEAVGGGSLDDVTQGAVDAARSALQSTPRQLETLREAGVVDAGGAGYLLVLEALLRVVRGEHGLADPDRPAAWLPATGAARAVPAQGLGAHADSGGPAYEVMYLLDDTDDERARSLSAQLESIGDSVVIAGGPALFSVHVHTDDIAAALEAGASNGRPHRFAVTRFADQPGLGAEPCPGDAPRAGDDDVRLAAVVSGAGLADRVRQRGGTPVEAGDSALLEEVVGAPPVVVVCDSPETRRAAERAAAGREGVTVGCDDPVTLLAALDLLERDRRAKPLDQQLDDLEGEIAVLSYPDPFDLAVARAELTDALAGAELVSVVAGAALRSEELRAVVDLVGAVAEYAEVTVLESGAAQPALAVGCE